MHQAHDFPTADVVVYARMWSGGLRATAAGFPWGDLCCITLCGTLIGLCSSLAHPIDKAAYHT